MEDERPDEGADDESGVGGRLKEAVGWATGDREVEAKGRAEQEEDRSDPPPVEDVEVEVRKDHGDIRSV